jgi:hypothetical protein
VIFSIDTKVEEDGKEKSIKRPLVSVLFDPDKGGYIVQVNCRTPLGDYKAFQSRKAANRSARLLWKTLKTIPYSPVLGSQFVNRVTSWLQGSMKKTGGADNPGRPGIRQTPEWLARKAQKRAAWEAKHKKATNPEAAANADGQSS